MKDLKGDILILGAGIVGLSLAYRLVERGISKNILVIEKEKKIGSHTSGRNSGVLHSGLYYKPETLKAKVCSKGSKRMREWILDRNLSINDCGKIIVPSSKSDDKMLDTLFERGKKNGCDIEMWTNNKINEFIPEAFSYSGRAIWSPKTAVINPKEVLNQLEKELTQKGVKILKDSKINNIDSQNRMFEINNSNKIVYDYLFNTTGLQSDRVSKLFKIDHPYVLLPFKGLYWKLKTKSGIKINCNLYPVPDLNVPFLGVHFTPNTRGDVYIGPTATAAWGRENYNNFENIEPQMAVNNLFILGKQYLYNKGGFRRYVHEQAFQSFKPFLINAAQKLVPGIKAEHIENSDKVGIRAQLYDLKRMSLVDDFLSINDESSTHVLNAISPAFTSSFELADLIINRSNLSSSNE